MKIQIKNRSNLSIIFECDADSLKIAVELAKANLSGADLYGADLSKANLSGADLYGANLYGANLYGANLSKADLSKANLSGADLYGANLSKANLSGADLYGADLSGANLYGANLSKANLYGADLFKANLENKYIYKNSTCPRSGDFLAWKKLSGGFICKLKIPASVRRTFCVSSRKCRAEAAIVLDIFEPTTNKHLSEGINGTHSKKQLKYIVGEWVKADHYDADFFKDCSNGIHFFMDYQDALDW